jgi:uncharacterized membrane protein
MPNQLDRLLHPHDQRMILAAVVAAERRTSAQFKVHVEASCHQPHARARELLGRLKVTRTDRANGVLLFLTVHDRRCVLVADDGLRALQASPRWQEIVHRLTLDLRHGRVGNGVADALTSLSKIIAPHFPRGAVHVNEVRDDITTEEVALSA